MSARAPRWALRSADVPQMVCSACMADTNVKQKKQKHFENRTHQIKSSSSGSNATNWTTFRPQREMSKVSLVSSIIWQMHAYRAYQSLHSIWLRCRMMPHVQKNKSTWCHSHSRFFLSLIVSPGNDLPFPYALISFLDILCLLSAQADAIVQK